MATLTIRNIPDDAKQRLRELAAAHGRSMEEHLRQMIVEAGHAGVAPETMASGVNDMRPSFEHAPVTDPRPDPRVLSRARIERLMGLEVPRLEMFARSSAGGWDAWGNQTEKFG